MRLITALEIAGNYPDNILIAAAQHKETGKWTSLMYMLRDDKQIHKLMLSFDINEKFLGWDTEQEAIEKMEDVAKAAMDAAAENKASLDGWFATLP